jgi:hypothetical protein
VWCRLSSGQNCTVAADIGSLTVSVGGNSFPLNSVQFTAAPACAGLTLASLGGAARVVGKRLRGPALGYARDEAAIRATGHLLLVSGRMVTLRRSQSRGAARRRD